MIGYIALVICYILAFLREARHDAVISRIQGQTPEESLEWHRLDWQYLALIGVGVSIFGGGYYWNMDLLELGISLLKSLCIGTTIGTLKVLIFNIRINKIFGHSWDYLSSTGFEAKFKGKEKIYYGVSLSGFLSAASFMIYYYGTINSII